MEEKLQNSISTKQLYKEYDWYQNTFPLPIQEACDDFLDNKFKLGFIGLSKNINCLLENEPCFVTKIKLDNEHDVFFRLTDKAVNVILNNTLGQSKNKFNINKISQLEARIITSFNDFIFEKIKSELAEPDPTLLRRDDFNMIHLTFVIKAKDSQNPLVGKFIITLPQVLLKPEEIISSGETFDEENFPQCETFAKAFIGKTKFSLYDIKHLENDDVVVFENSQTNSIKITIDNENLDVNLNPNMEILIPDIESGGSDMVDTHQDIWDSIEVEMSAEIESVKITLGELKNIENGLVVDLASLYDNKVTLTVEGKPIANGALVIVNDRYGVKIDEVFAQNEIKNKSNPNESAEEKEEIPPPEESEEETQAPKEGSEDEEFDYSDFELEDENI
jgi:flagellar motor switch protein FliM